MTVNVKSLQAKLLNVSKQKGIEFQLFLTRFAAEQFLARLSQSPMKRRFVFKGGSLLTYLIDTERKTRDLDFSVKKMSHAVEDLREIVQSILEIPLDDGITWNPAKASTLNHPEMPYPGARIICPFHLGQMKGQVRMDLAFGDQVEPVKTTLFKIQYKGKPLVGEDFSLLAYPPETIFSEKLQIALVRIEKLQISWSHYRTKEKLKDAPESISEIIEQVNRLLNQVFANE